MGRLNSVLCVSQIRELSWASVTFSLFHAGMEKILGTGSERAVDLLGQRFGSPVSAALGGKDREDVSTWHAQISSMGQPELWP